MPLRAGLWSGSAAEEAAAAGLGRLHFMGRLWGVGHLVRGLFRAE